MEAHQNIRLIGRREFVDFPELKLSGLEAKIDTGAYTTAIHCTHISLVTRGDKQVLSFKIPTATLSELSTTYYEVENFSRKKIKNSFGEMEERYVIKTPIRIGNKSIRTTISLSDRENMRYPVLIGRRYLKGYFVVDVRKVHTGAPKLESVINEYI